MTAILSVFAHVQLKYHSHEGSIPPLDSVQTEVKMAASEGMKDSPNLDPPDDWELNNFLLEVCDMLEEEDLQKMKTLCTGKGGFGRGVLERLVTPLQFFDLLRQTERLTRHNLIFLQALIWSVGRRDIHKKFVEFGRENEDALHFFVPKDKPENGYKYLKFHVGGDTQNYSVRALGDLHACVARLLRVPGKFVFITGIEPSNSLLITFMVPEDVVYVIMEMTEGEKKDLVQYDIQNVLVEDKLISLKGEKPSDSFLREELESKKLLEKELRQEKEIESLQIKLLEANKALSECRNLPRTHANELLIWLSFIYNLYCATAQSRKAQKVPTCKMLAAQLIQRRMLLRSRELGYDETIINLLMDANAVIIIEHIKTKKDMTTTALLQMITSLRNDNCLLQYKLNQLMFYCRVKDDKRIMSEREKFFLSHVLQGQPIGLNFQIDTEMIEKLDHSFVMQVLKTLSKAMTKIERRKVLNNSSLTSDEKSFIQHNPDQLLSVMLDKERLQTGAGVNILVWLQTILLPLGNQKLLQRGIDMINPHSKVHKSGQHKRKRARSVGPDIEVPKSRQGKGSTGGKCSNEEEREKASQRAEFVSCEHDDELKEKINNLERMMSSLQRDVGFLKDKADPYSQLSFLKHDSKWQLNPDILSKSNGVSY